METKEKRRYDLEDEELENEDEQEEREDDNQGEEDEEHTESVDVPHDGKLLGKLLERVSREKAIEEIDSKVVFADGMSVDYKVKKCRYKEELENLISDHLGGESFDDKILSVRFEGNLDEADRLEKLQTLYESTIKVLPTKEDFISNYLVERNKEIDSANQRTINATKEKQKPKAETTAPVTKKYKYPFIIHMAGRNIETDHIFTNDTEYTEDQIRTKMLEHQYYDFAGTTSFTYLKDENVLLPIFQQHKKG